MKVKILQNNYGSEVSLVGCVFNARRKDGMYYIKGSEILAVGGRYFTRDHEYSFEESSVEVIPETFKVGDKVRLKKEFYKEEEFKGMSRSLKKPIAYLQGKSVSVIGVPNFNRNDVAIIVTDGVDIYIFPPCIFELAEPEKKPVVEVKRHAKVGEWIKIIRAENTNGKYKNGDILQVREMDVMGVGVYVSKFYHVICHKEYVVLENYEPPKNDDAFDSLAFYFDALSYALSEHVNLVAKTRRWTPEEIVKAKCFLGGELIYAKCKFVYDKKNGRTACFNYENGRSAEAKRAPNDEFNPYIGAVVAYCKTCGVKIPEFITH